MAKKNSTIITEEMIKKFDEYLLDLERSKNTRVTYIRSVKAYAKLFDEVTKENLVAFKEYEVEHVKPTTAALRCLAMNIYCDFIGKPEMKVKRVKYFKASSVENIPSKEEYERFLELLLENGNIKMYWMLRFMAGTGARASELVKLEKSCLKTGEMSLWTKGKVRKILVPKKLIDESREYFYGVDSNYLFPSRYGGMMQPQSISKMMYKYGNRYGVRSEVLHPHAYRHLFAILFLEKNGNLTLLANLMGHESINTTSIYLQMSEEEQRKQLNEAMEW